MTQAALELYNYERQYRRRVRLTVMKVVLFFIGIIVVGIVCYRMGLTISDQQIDMLTTENQTLKTQRRESTQTIEQQKQMIDALNTQIPHGETVQLLELLNARLSEGVSPQRLTEVLSLVENKRTCDGLQSKRFILSTPLVSPEVTRISFFNGMITVMGNGESFINEQGLQEAWFDPGQPVSMTIQKHGKDQQIIVEGIIPIYHSVMIHDHEYRMTIAQNDNLSEYVSVTVDRCQFL